MPAAFAASGLFGRLSATYFGRPFSSNPVAQVIFETNGVALMNLPFSRFRTKKKPLRSALAPALIVWPPFFSSNGMNSLVPS